MSIGAHELTIRAGITYRMLDFWTRTGRLHAVNGNTPGSGIAREYSDEEARIAVIMGRLVRAGLDPTTARHLAEHMDRTGEATLGGFKVTAAKPVRRRGWYLAGRRAA